MLGGNYRSGRLRKRALLEQGESDMSEEKGVVKVGCGNCGYVMLLDAETVGIRGLWAEGREL